MKKNPACVSFAYESPTLAVNDVNENVNDNDGACPADACTVGTTEWKVKPYVVTAPEYVNAEVRNRQWQWIQHMKE